jgi:hypothetical protein
VCTLVLLGHCIRSSLSSDMKIITATQKLSCSQQNHSELNLVNRFYFQMKSSLQRLLGLAFLFVLEEECGHKLTKGFLRPPRPPTETKLVIKRGSAGAALPVCTIRSCEMCSGSRRSLVRLLHGGRETAESDLAITSSSPSRAPIRRFINPSICLGEVKLVQAPAMRSALLCGQRPEGEERKKGRGARGALPS